MDGTGDNSKHESGVGERLSLSLARATSRNGFLVKAGWILLKALGISAIPFVLPVDRIFRPVQACCGAGGGTTLPCDAWQLCGLYGKTCCNTCSGGIGGNFCNCPSNTTRNSGCWTSCCYDAVHDQLWTFRYYDCCGTGVDCSTCTTCHNGCGRPPWCDSGSYVCTVAVKLNACSVYTNCGSVC